MTSEPHLTRTMHGDAEGETPNIDAALVKLNDQRVRVLEEAIDLIKTAPIRDRMDGATENWVIRRHKLLNYPHLF